MKNTPGNVDMILTALAYRDSSNDKAIKALSDEQVIAAVKAHQKLGRPKKRSTISYKDPTGNTAAGRADKRR